MITISIAIILIGLLFCYYTSKRIAVFPNNQLHHWSKENIKISNTVGGMLLAIGIWVCIYSFGLGTGIFAFLVFSMTLLSLIVLLIPLKIFTYKSIAILLLISFLTEKFIV